MSDDKYTFTEADEGNTIFSMRCSRCFTFDMSPELTWIKRGDLVGWYCAPCMEVAPKPFTTATYEITKVTTTELPLEEK